MKYQLVSKENPKDRRESKLYACPVNDGRIEKADLAREIAGISALSRGDVSSVIENLIDIIPKYLMMGKSVSLGELGILRVSFSSEGVEDQKQFKVNKISSPKVVFRASCELKRELRDIRFEARRPATGATASGSEDGFED
jgi:predicted histone-like DNA-binding protein